MNHKSNREEEIVQGEHKSDDNSRNTSLGFINTILRIFRLNGVFLNSSRKKKSNSTEDDIYPLF